MPINYIAAIQVQKNDRVYSLILPNDAPFEEAKTACLELALQIDEVKKQREEALEKAKLEKEVDNQKAEAAQG